MSLLETLGGPGSGNFGHSGRPGERGGSGGFSSAKEYITGKKMTGDDHLESDAQAEWESEIQSDPEHAETLRAWKNGIGGYHGDGAHLSAKEKQREKEITAKLAALVESAPQFEGVVYRGSASTNLLELKEGQTFTTDRMISTSRDPKVGEKFTAGQVDSASGGTLFEIHTKEGAAVENLGLTDKRGNIRYQKEREVIVPQGVKFKVEKVHRKSWTESGRYKKDVTIVVLRQK